MDNDYEDHVWWNDIAYLRLLYCAAVILEQTCVPSHGHLLQRSPDICYLSL